MKRQLQAIAVALMYLVVVIAALSLSGLVHLESAARWSIRQARRLIGSKA